MKDLDIVILAAGRGERMISHKPKVMHEIMGKPLLGHVVDVAGSLEPARTIVVTGYRRHIVETYLEGKGVTTAFQEEQKGTAHALACARGHLEGNDVLVLLGDVPLIETSTLIRFLEFCRAATTIVFLTTDVDDPSGYGRVVMDGDIIADIREDADATAEERLIHRINTGICYIPFRDLALIDLIDTANKKGERYLTDICKVARAEGGHAKGFFHPRAEEVLGVNTLKGLLQANTVMRQRINEEHMARGVTFLDTDIYVEKDVVIGRETVIAPHCHIAGATVIGEGVYIGPSSIIRNCRIGDGATIAGLVFMEGVEAKEGVSIGALSRFKQDMVLERRA